jgi:hypothetical protein
LEVQSPDEWEQKALRRTVLRKNEENGEWGLYFASAAPPSNSECCRCRSTNFGSSWFSSFVQPRDHASGRIEVV